MAYTFRRWRALLSCRVPARRDRLIVAAAVTAIMLAFFWGGTSSPGYRSDLDQVWYASRALLQGRDPFVMVGPGRAFDNGFPLYYPLPTLIAFMPLALLPLVAARFLFVGLSAAVLAYAVTARGWFRLPLFLSGAFLASLAAVQWAPLLTAALLLPALAPLILLKPNIGAAFLAATPNRTVFHAGLAGGACLLLVSLVVDPGWPAHWLAAVRAGPHFTPPVLYPGGQLVLLALLRWRRPEARLLVALACVPQTALAYETLPLLLLASNWRESLSLAGLSLLSLVLQFQLDQRVPASDPAALAAFTAWVHSMGLVLVALMYLPATILVLRRPNRGMLPAWYGWLRRTRRMAVPRGGSPGPRVSGA